MPTVKLGWKEFDVKCDEIIVYNCGVTDADCVAFAARMKTGEISRVKTLIIVRFVFVTCEFMFVSSSMFESVDARFTERTYR
jgi:hypothetical protein